MNAPLRVPTSRRTPLIMRSFVDDDHGPALAGPSLTEIVDQASPRSTAPCIVRVIQPSGEIEYGFAIQRHRCCGRCGGRACVPGAARAGVEVRCARWWDAADRLRGTACPSRDGAHRRYQNRGGRTVLRGEGPG